MWQRCEKAQTEEEKKQNSISRILISLFLFSRTTLWPNNINKNSIACRGETFQNNKMQSNEL